MDKDVKVETHPSYGQAVFNRRTGSTGRMYGSPLADHHATIALSISRSETVHDLGRDWRHATEQLIEVEFSAAQFADLLTNMNVGEGVPCTIGWIKDEGRVPPPEIQAEHEKVVDAFKGQVSGTAKVLRENLIQLGALLEKKSLSKADKDKIYWMVEKSLQDVESNAPFMLEQFGEATEKVVTAARAEVAASTIAIVQKLGFEKLDDMRQVVAGASPRVPQIERSPIARALDEAGITRVHQHDMGGELVVGVRDPDNCALCKDAK